MRDRFGALLMVVAVAAALVTGCGGGGSPGSQGPFSDESSTDETSSSDKDAKTAGDWFDAPGKVQFYNYLVDGGEEITVDLYWFATEIVDGYKEFEHTEKFATLDYGDHTDVMSSRYFGLPDAELDELQYLAVPTGTDVEEQADKFETGGVLGGEEAYLKTDLYHSNSDAPTKYLNDEGTVVVFLSPDTHGDTEARPRVQSFYADLYPGGEVNFPATEDEIPKAGPGQVVLPIGYLFGTQTRSPTGGRLAELMGWRWSADGACLPEDESNIYGGDGEAWMYAVSETAKITIHPTFHFTGPTDCSAPAWQEPISLQGKRRPFGLIVPTSAGEPRMEIIEIPS